MNLSYSDVVQNVAKQSGYMWLNVHDLKAKTVESERDCPLAVIMKDRKNPRDFMEF